MHKYNAIVNFDGENESATMTDDRKCVTESTAYETRQQQQSYILKEGIASEQQYLRARQCNSMNPKRANEDDSADTSEP